MRHSAGVLPPTPCPWDEDRPRAPSVPRWPGLTETLPCCPPASLATRVAPRAGGGNYANPSRRVPGPGVAPLLADFAVWEERQGDLRVWPGRNSALLLSQGCACSSLRSTSTPVACGLVQGGLVLAGCGRGGPSSHLACRPLLATPRHHRASPGEFRVGEISMASQCDREVTAACPQVTASRASPQRLRVRLKS